MSWRTCVPEKATLEPSPAVTDREITRPDGENRDVMLGVMAIVGLPPFGVFTSEFLILTATIKDAPLMAPLLLLGLAVTFAALFRRLQPMVLGPIPPYQKRVKVAHVPVLLHMVLVLVLGLYMPTFLAGWFHTAVGLLK